MGCNCGKKKKEPVVQKYYIPATETEPAQIVESIGVPQTPEQQHTQDMDNHAKKLSEETIDWFNNIDTITPLNDGQTRET